ncbi:nuclear matrix constituent protein 1-like isoform X1 [Nymphaea colorata]|nr:nuclear matrix constituent protein 1-like isoform X1 [Nymphaea colorata]XP_031491693.1 nuclear matrix constituent protein 1-like isoform X1 [Nymphaea colorata]XP_031491694.1 nuclear matrix constituent protein 1-like isoform X1 [Nymphaea colorata]
MFTPQRKGWPRWSLTPGKTDAGKNETSASAKGKAVLECPPPRASLEENGGVVTPGMFSSPGEVEVWKRFREAGALEPASLEKKEREALAERVTKLEAELYDYQYNMGLLLIEKKDWPAKFENLNQALMEAEENLKREQAAHLIALSEAEKREEACRKALGVEKQCVSDMEKALHEMRVESAEVKFTSDKKLAEAQALVAGVEEKSLEAAAKIHSAEARLAEANRKMSDAERKLQEVDARESTIKKERASLKAEREAHEEAFSRERENLRDWDKKLQEGQERLVEGQRLLNQREEKVNEKEKALMQKEKELEDLRRKVEIDVVACKEKEADISSRLSKLADQEEEATAKRSALEVKEKELIELQDALNAKENEGIQRVVDEHKAMLESRKCEFEAELELKRKAVDEELKLKELAVDERVKEVDRKEEKVAKREQMLEKREEKLKEKQKDLDSKLKALKEREKSIKTEEKSILAEKNLISAEKDQLESTKFELENLKAALAEEKQQICNEQENLKVTQDERRDFERQKSILKQEIEDSLLRKNLLIEEGEELKRERENFEREWTVLDERREDLKKELAHVNEEKARLKEWVDGERARLENEKKIAMEDIEREKEAIRLKKEAFESNMAHERSELYEQAHRELEFKRQNFELEMSQREDQIKSDLDLRDMNFRDEVRVFQEYKERVLKDINSQKDVVQQQVEELHQNLQKLEKEREQLVTERRYVEGQHLEISRDSEQLLVLSEKLKDERKAFAKRMEAFLACLEQLKHTVGDDIIMEELRRSELQLQKLKDIETDLLPTLVDGYMKEISNLGSLAEVMPGELGPDSNSPGRMSWLRKCASKIFNLSPIKRSEASPETLNGRSPSRFASQPELPASTENIAAVVHGVLPEDSYQVEDEPRQSLDTRNCRDEAVEAASLDDRDNSQSIVSSSSRQKPGRRRKTKGIRRSRSVKATVDEAKAYLAGAETQSQEHREGSVDGDAGAWQKRQSTVSSFATSDADDTEVRSDSVTGRMRKRKATNVADAETPGRKRYNLRRSTVANTDAAQTSAAKLDNHFGEQDKSAKVQDNAVDKDAGARALSEVHDTRQVASDHRRAPGALKEAAQGGLRVCESGNSSPQVEQTIVQVHQYSSQKITKVETEVGVESNFNGETAGIDILNYIEQENGGNALLEERDEAAAYDEDEGSSEDDGYENEDDDDAHNKSIGKKLWNFFTT